MGAIFARIWGTVHAFLDYFYKIGEPIGEQLMQTQKMKKKRIQRVSTAAELRKLDPGLLKKLVLHRGYHDLSDCVERRPLENTAQAFTKGWDMGVAHAECDVTVTKDGKVVIVHDENLLRVGNLEHLTPRNGSSKTAQYSDDIGRLTYDEIQNLDLVGGHRVPLLETVLEESLTRNDCKLVVELKYDKYAGKLISEMIELFSAKPSLLRGVGVFMSFNHSLVKLLRIGLAKRLEHSPPPFFLGLTDTQIYPGFEDIVWDIQNDGSVATALRWVSDNNLDGLYLRHQPCFHEEPIKRRLKSLIETHRLTIGLWDVPDNVTEQTYWTNFGVRFINTDLDAPFQSVTE